jgi:hypothetical protein
MAIAILCRQANALAQASVPALQGDLLLRWKKITIFERETNIGKPAANGAVLRDCGITFV